MIELSHVTKIFPGKEKAVHAVNDVTLSIADGTVYGIVGYSGAGKSTLVRCLNFLERPDSGSIAIGGFGIVRAEGGKLYFCREEEQEEKRLSEKELRALRREIGMIFQHFNLLDRSTVYDNIAYPLKYTGRSKEEIDRRVRELLKLVDLEDKLLSYPSELSGGQKQRVAIARALANDPKILLSDEATSALDPDATESILKLLKSLNETLGITIVLITHEMAVVKTICDRMAVMENGCVVEEGEVYQVFAHPQQPITRKFVNSASNLGTVDKLLEEGSALVSPARGGVLIKCIYGKDAVGDAIISEISRRFNVNVSIVLADVEMLKDSTLGGMIEMMTGDGKDIDAAIDYLKECKVDVEVMADGRVD